MVTSARTSAIGVGEDALGLGAGSASCPANKGAAMRTGWAARMASRSCGRSRPAIARTVAARTCSSIAKASRRTMSSACRVASLVRRPDPRQQVDQLAPAHRAVARDRRPGRRATSGGGRRSASRTHPFANSVPICASRAIDSEGRSVNRPVSGQDAQVAEKGCEKGRRPAPTPLVTDSVVRCLSYAAWRRSPNNARLRRAVR